MLSRYFPCQARIGRLLWSLHSTARCSTCKSIKLKPYITLLSAAPGLQDQRNTWLPSMLLASKHMSRCTAHLKSFCAPWDPCDSFCVLYNDVWSTKLYIALNYNAWQCINYYIYQMVLFIIRVYVRWIITLRSNASKLALVQRRLNLRGFVLPKRPQQRDQMKQFVCPSSW